MESEGARATAEGVPAGRHDKCFEALVALYAAWDKAEPGKGFETKAEQWKAKRAANQPAAPR